ncbi:hypothetical protein Pfo_024505 [Paulownia fortunei]|nr:hypothetical protein Pfo_024505 [Paulownia fortunei]
MASYQLIKEAGEERTLDLRGKNCAVRVDGGHGGDKINHRIAAAYCVAAMCEIWLRNVEKVSSGLSLLKKYQWHWTVVFVLTTIYLLLLYGLYVPDWEYQIPYDASSEAKIFMVTCGVHGDTGPACNDAGMIDRIILGVITYIGSQYMPEQNNAVSTHQIMAHFLLVLLHGVKPPSTQKDF